MDLEKAKKIIDTLVKDSDFLAECKLGERYYRGDNDIKYPEKVPKPWLDKNGLREANNRVANNFFNFQVNQKASYLEGDPTTFDLGNDSWNEAVSEQLGGHWNKTCKHLVVNAATCGIAWLHSWIDEEHDFNYGVVDSKQIIAYWGDILNSKLLLLVRTYILTDKEGDTYDIFEIWDDTYCHSYSRKRTKPVGKLEEYYMFYRYNPITNEKEFTNEYEHGFSKIPFSAFPNNSNKLNDLTQVKGYLDAYDKAFSLFLDNIEDVQEVIYVFENLGGTNLEDALRSLKKQKAIKVLNTDQVKTGISTLTVEIPTEASQTLLDLTRKNIFEQGQAVDPSPENYAGNTSGEALKYMYANLELKATNTEDEFRIGFEHFIKLMCEYFNFKPKKIIQNWNRTKINNETEIINNLRNSVGILSDETLVRLHPMIDDKEGELKKKEEEAQKKKDETDLYLESFNNSSNNEEETNQEELEEDKKVNGNTK